MKQIASGLTIIETQLGPESETSLVTGNRADWRYADHVENDQHSVSRLGRRNDMKQCTCPQARFTLCKIVRLNAVHIWRILTITLLVFQSSEGPLGLMGGIRQWLLPLNE